MMCFVVGYSYTQVNCIRFQRSITLKVITIAINFIRLEMVHYLLFNNHDELLRHSSKEIIDSMYGLRRLATSILYICVCAYVIFSIKSY